MTGAGGGGGVLMLTRSNGTLAVGQSLQHPVMCLVHIPYYARLPGSSWNSGCVVKQTTRKDHAYVRLNPMVYAGE